MPGDEPFTCDICGDTFETKWGIGGYIRAHQVRVPREEILSELRRLADENGRTPTQPEVNDGTSFTAGAVQSTFGSWKEGLDAAGLDPLSHDFTDSELLKELQRVATVLGDTPTIPEFDAQAEMSASTVQDRFGSWTDAVKSAGLEPNQLRDPTKRDVVGAISNLADQLGHQPTAAEMDDEGAISVKTAQRLYGSWNAAVSKAGFTPQSRKDIPEEELLTEISRLSETLDHTPSSEEMNSNGRFSLPTYIRRYGSWKSAVEAAGHEYRGHPSGPDAPGWTGGYGDISYGPNWHLQREQALNRDTYQCQHPGCTIDRSEHQNRFNRDLTVHHLMQLRKYVGSDGVLDYERANQLENLVTLCQIHHPYWEKLAPLRPDIR